MDNVQNLLNSIKKSTNNVPKQITPQDKQQLLEGLRDRIFGFIKASDIPKYFRLLKIDLNQNDKNIKIDFKELDTRDIKLVSRFDNYTVPQLENEYNELTKKISKINRNDPKQRNDLFIKSKEISEICRLLAKKDPKNKQWWINNEKNIRNSLFPKKRK